ncbi:CBS domain-containing protein [Streptomyces sp. NPDC047315]|uniref:CBS domain-containing protein n=1 Tax=Streptomyces sp. NPDC047315 TaxID=3155142 RepID=UPI0034115A33
MHHRTVADLMTRNVVSVRRGTAFKEIVKELTQSDVSAAPVLDEEGRVVGVVSEADLMRKTADQSGPSGRIPLPDVSGEDLAKAGASRAEELMSAPAVCARPEWNVVEAARLMTVQNVKRLPVVDETDRLVGIVSRADVLRVFLRRDEAIREEIQRDVLEDALALAPSAVTAEVEEGRVTLTGTVGRAAVIPIVERLCQSVDGVVSVSVRITPSEEGSAPLLDGWFPNPPRTGGERR